MDIGRVENKTIDASSIFYQKAQEHQVSTLLEKMESLELHPDLNETIQAIEKINVKALSPQGKEKYQTLCGRIHTINVNQLVNMIFDEAYALHKGECGSSEELSKRTSELKLMIADIWDSHSSFSKENLGFIKSATKILNRLESPSHSKIDEMPIEIEEITPNYENAADSLELFAMAHLLYQGKIDEGILKFRTFPPSIQEMLGEEKAIAINPCAFMQKAVTLAYDQVRGDGYTPSLKEIELMFQEAATFA